MSSTERDERARRPGQSQAVRREDLVAVDAALRGLPPIDPPRVVVQRTLERVASAQARSRRARHLGAMALAIAVVLLTVGVALVVQRPTAEPMLAEQVAPQDLDNRGPNAAAVEGRFTADPSVAGNQPADRLSQLGDDRGAATRDAEYPPADPATTVPAQELHWRQPAAADGKGRGVIAIMDGEEGADGKDDRDGFDGTFTGGLRNGLTDESTREETIDGKRVQLDAQAITMKPGFYETTIELGDVGRDQAVDLVTRLPEGGEVTKNERDGWLEAQNGTLDKNLDDLADLGKKANAQRETVDIPPDLRFIPARGYFANTYVPGDGDVVRFDLARVTGKLGGEVPALEAVRGVSQPFDRPVGQALSLQLAADRTAVEGPTRVTLQVGLAAAAPVKARRAPIACALVVDVASVQDDADRQTLWSLADALLAERQPGDAFALIVPRASGPSVLRGDALTASEVTRTLAAAAEERHALDPAAIAVAYRTVQEARAVSAAPSNKRGMTLGASTVVVATASGIGGELAVGLGERAHVEALGDIQLSAIGAGARVDRGALASLAQRGQGRRWLATSPADARRVIGEELSSAGRTVARAVRLRIRLAPGVELVGVIGSHPLEIADRKQAREAEAAINRRLADTTGIAADRGDDEDGIQIVIPAFMAGDDHAVLLDVVVSGPGPVLDVRMRWKDLLRMDNAEAQASLALPSGADQATPLALNVVENHAAMIASEALLAAAHDIARQQPGSARPILSMARRKLDALARRAPAVKQQTRVVDHYEALIREAPAWIQDDAARDEMVRALESTGRTLR